jgi:hypothetical protein
MVFDKKQKKEVLSIDYDSTIDFRALGKSTVSIYDHSKFACIMPNTTLKQKALKVQFVKLTNEEQFQRQNLIQND